MNTRTNEELLEILRTEVELAEMGIVSISLISNLLREIETRAPDKNGAIRQQAERLYQRYRSAAR